MFDLHLSREVAPGKPSHEGAQIDAAGRKGPRGTVGGVGEGHIEVDDGGAEARHGIGRSVEREIDAVVVPGGVGDPLHAALATRRMPFSGFSMANTTASITRHADSSSEPSQVVSRSRPRTREPAQATR